MLRSLFIFPALSVALLVLSGWAHAAAPPAEFLQGPGQVGRVLTLRGTVLGERAGLASAGERCHLVLADRSRTPAARGLGGGGRFFLCGHGLRLRSGQPWTGTVRQTGTGRTKVGQRWRVVPRFELAR